tara:strand:+ start:581 stop:1702 length:1122 start_codon:yes stop_codon:yes gene_type:complete
MTRLIKKFLAYVMVFFSPSVKTRKKSIRTPGLYTFRKTILQKLAWYFSVIKRLKKGDPETFKLYSKIGASIVSQEDAVTAEYSFGDEELCPWWKTHRPTFGALFFSDGSWPGDKGFMQPTMVCFRKYAKGKEPCEIQKGSGAIYCVTVCWDKREWKNGRPTEFPVSIDKNNKITVLKTKHYGEQSIRAKKRRRGRVFTVPTKKFLIDPFFADWAVGQKASSTEIHLTYIFVHAANLYAAQDHEMTKIKCTKNRLSAVFSIDVLKTPYFFKDRDATTLVNGKRKKIFHIVRAHKRVTNGIASFVKTHFRGERYFMWNGYKVRITVPGWHHMNLIELDVGAVDEEHHDHSEKVLYSDDFAKHISDWEEDGIGAKA